MTPSLIAEIETRIKLDWSSGQVSGQLKDEQGVMISHERIYQHVWPINYVADCYTSICVSAIRNEKKKYGSKDRCGQIRNHISIEERPSIVAEKTRIGDWETETVIGQNHQGALITIVDRVSKFTLIKIIIAID